MRLGARIYATTEGFADAAEAVALRVRIAEELDRRFEAGQLAGYEAGSIASEDEWENAAVDREVIEAVTGGALPVVFANLTYDLDDPRQREADHSEIVARFALHEALWVTPPAG